MLKLALDAELPIIAVHTRDSLNLPDVLKEITKREAVPFVANAPSKEHGLYLHFCKQGESLALGVLYTKMTKSESSLILVNPAKIEEPMFDAGEVPVPRSLMMHFMSEVTDSPKKAEELLRGLGGCTLKEAAELARLTMARDKSLTVQGLMMTRKTSFQGAKGLTQVDSAQTFYDPPAELVAWAKAEKKHFLFGTDHRLIPRGLLLDGPPGTGKTAGSKWLAEQFGVPLYRFDVGGAKGKYVGESEAGMLLNLSRLDHAEPAIALFDEVEKIFSTDNHDTSGTTSTMMSQLLWWLAERRSRVLTVMTTNKAKSLPPELYREGRVDKVLWFDRLEYDAAHGFAKQVLATFPKVKATDDAITDIVKKAFASESLTQGAPLRASQATITQKVFGYVKSQIV